MKIDKKLYQDIKEFCELNEIKTDDFINKILKESFLKEKYGDSPFTKNNSLNNKNDVLTNDIANTPVVVTDVTIMNDIEKEKKNDTQENDNSKEDNEIKENLSENIKIVKKKRNLK